MKKQRIVIGIDIGGTNTAFGLVDENKNVLFKELFPTNADEGANIFISRLLKHIKKIYDPDRNEYLLEGIGIAAPGANRFTGRIESPANLKWESINIVDMIRNYFNVSITLINDANAAALGEQYFGAAVGMKNFIVLTIGTGLGSGIVIDGKLMYGENGIAGELGHIIVKPEGRLCGCKRKGCLETYVSALGICRTVFELLAKSTEDSELRYISYNSLTAEKIYQLAVKGDSIALQAFKVTGESLGLMLSNIAAAFDPQAIILAGGLIKAGDLLIEPATRFFNENALYFQKRKVSILRSKFIDGEGAFLGASCLIDKTSLAFSNDYLELTKTSSEDKIPADQE